MSQIDEILESTQDVGVALFKQDMLMKNLSSKQVALEQAQQQRLELQMVQSKIEQLVEMFREMETMLATQESQVITIDSAVEDTVLEIEAATKELDKGIQLRMSYRRKARIFTAALALVLVATGVILYFILSQKSTD